MSPVKIVAGKSLVILGLNSGTSADGLDLAAIKIQSRKSKIISTYLAGSNLRYPKKLRDILLHAITAKSLSPEHLIALDNRLGIFFGISAEKFINKLRAKRITVDAVASHGQTIRHLPQKIKLAGGRFGGSLQIGSPDVIAALTGKPVISDFRQADIALGGEGAPITVAAMHQLYSDKKENRLIVNIGGISNYFFFPASSAIEHSLAADCGPGNSLIDILAKKLFNLPFDRNGRLASKGRVSPELLRELKKSSFFASKRKSTGREEFGEIQAEKMIKAAGRKKLNSYDLLATATELTIWSITKEIKKLTIPENIPAKLYLTGGGAHNTFIRGKLEENLSRFAVCLIDSLGIPTDQVEAAAFAVMGEAALRGRPMQTRFGRISGNVPIPVSGRISWPPVCR